MHLLSRCTPAHAHPCILTPRRTSFDEVVGTPLTRPENHQQLHALFVLLPRSISPSICINKTSKVLLVSLSCLVSSTYTPIPGLVPSTEPWLTVNAFARRPASLIHSRPSDSRPQAALHQRSPPFPILLHQPHHVIDGRVALSTKPCSAEKVCTSRTTLSESAHAFPPRSAGRVPRCPGPS
jgi:hypothetical protein